MKKKFGKNIFKYDRQLEMRNKKAKERAENNNRKAKT
jgi:hypothetical protein